MSDQVAEVRATYLVETEQDAVPVGYKQTEVGVIPKEWEVKRISEIASVFSGGTPNRETSYYWDGDIPWVTTSLIDGAEITTAKEFITRKGVESSSAKWCKSGTILIAMYGQGKTRGKTALLNINVTINQACAAIELKDSNYNKYIFHMLKSMYGRIRELSNSGGQENLSSGIIKSISIPFPSKKEQTAIANALSDVDALISELEKLIAKKQAIKTATMQQLLTGRKRLPQFALREDGTPKGYKQSELGKIPEDWDIEEIGDNCRTYSGGTPSTSNKNFYGGDIRWITSSDLNKGLIHEVQGRITEEGLRVSSAKLVVSHTFLIALYGATAGVCAITMVESAINQAVLAVVPISHTPKYLYYWFSKNKNEIIETYTQGGQPNLSGDIIRSIKLPMPSKQEQTAIATILSEMDEEIQALEQRLGKTRQIKQGMMQELLTGKTRLVAPAA